MSKNKRYIKSLVAHRKPLNELIGMIEEQHYTFQPTPTSMETQKLVNHLLKTTYKFARLAAKKSPDDLYSEEDTVSLTERANTYTEETIALIESLSDDDFDQIIDVKKIFGKEIPAEELLQMALEHEIHHKGQLFVYVRAMGHTDLPGFVSRNQ